MGWEPDGNGGFYWKPTRTVRASGVRYWSTKRRAYRAEADGTTNQRTVGSGPSNKARPKGKGRSTAVKDTPIPSREYRPDEPSSRRAGAFHAGAASAGRQQSWATMLSNFGANKENGEGWLGASAGRVRGMNNLMSHPETFMGRFLWVYAAKHVTDGIKQWRGWDAVSWDDFSDRKLHAAQEIAPSIVGKAIGTVGAAGVRVASLGSSLLTGALAITGLISESTGARADDLVSDYADWLSSGRGFRFSPVVTHQAANRAVSGEIERLKNNAVSTAVQKWNKNVNDNLARTKDAFAKRGVGSIAAVRDSLTARPDFRAALEDIKVSAKLNVHETEVWKRLYDRYRASGAP